MPSMSWRRRLAVVKTESVYGEAAADMSDATILEVVMLDAGNPYDGNTVERERIRYGFGANEQINTGPYVTRQIRVPFAGHGTKGEPPAYGALLRASGMSETIDETEGAEQVVYQPVSEGQESVEIWWFEDGQAQQILGARATWSMTTDAQGLPYIEFSVTGLYKRPELMPTVQGEQAVQAGEVPINKQNSQFSLFGVPSRLQSLSLDMGNQVEYRNLVNYEGVHITNRAAQGQINVEAPRLNENNLFEKVESHQGTTTGSVVLTHGTTPGNIIELSASRAQLSTISAQDNQGIMHYQMDARFLPTDSNDDDFTLTYK